VPEQTDLEKIHKQALDQFEVIQTREKDQRALAVEDSKFINVEDGQWDEEATEKRADRPRYTIDRVSPAIDQLVGDQRQNRTSIKVDPVSCGADEDGAKLMSGLIRNIEAQSKATQSYDGAYDENATGGYGGWRILTEYNDDDVFEQDITIKPIKSAATSLFFGRSDEYDKRGASHGFLIEDVDIEEFKREHPDVAITDFSADAYSTGVCTSWFRDNTMRIAEYWVKTPITKNLALLSDGRVIDKDEEEAVLDELAEKGITIVKERSVQSHKVQMYKMNGAEIYDGPNEWAGKFIPLVPEYGKVANIEGKEFIRGLVRKAKDPQRIYNYETSNSVEVGALAPKDPWWITAKQALGYENQLENYNVNNSPFMLYNADTDAPGPPQRGGAPSVQSGQIERIRQAESDLFMTTGMGPPSVGMNPGLQSGVALKRQDEKGDRGSYIFQDNHSKSIQYCGDILIDLIPRIYDTERMVRILHLDGKSEDVLINQKSLDDFNQPIMDEESGDQVIVNDLSKGKYEASVSTGPAYSTQREESAAQLIDLAASSPVFAELTLDIIAKNLNVLENDEITKRLRKRMIGQGTVDPTEDEIKEFGLDQEQPVDPQQQAITDNINMETEKSMIDIEMTDAKIYQMTIDNQKKAIESYETYIKTMELQKNAGFVIGKDEQELGEGVQATVEVTTDQTIP